MQRPDHPSQHDGADRGLQPERTALAWERTAAAHLVVGVLTARVGAEMATPWATAGVVQVLFGSILLVWAAHHYEDRLETLERDQRITHPRAAQVVGVGTVLFNGCAAIFCVVAAT